MYGDCTLPYNLRPGNHDLPRSLFRVVLRKGWNILSIFSVDDGALYP